MSLDLSKFDTEKFDINSKAFKVFWAMFENDRVSKWLGIEPLVIEEGYNELKMIVRDDMLNGFDILHGGILFSFADSSFAFATNSFGKMSVSINVNINYHEAVREGDVLITRTKLVNQTNKLCNLNVDLFKLESNNNKKLVSSFYGTAYRTSKDFNL